MAHLYYYGGTVDGLTITKEKLETAVSCMYEKSGSFAKVIQKIFRSKADTQIAIIVGEGTDEFSEVLHPDNYARYAAEHGLSPTWPYVGVDVVIIVDPRRLDGDYFPSGALNTLERALGHEFDHVPDVLKNGYGNEEKTTDAEDRIAFELYPDGPEQGRDEYANLPINVPSIGVQTTSTCDTDPITHTLPPRENNLDRPEQIRDLKGTAETNGSPLVLDLDDSGTIDLVSLGNSSIYWDIDEDGFRELTGWVQAVDGLLAYDLNENGIIDNNAELFGSVSTDGLNRPGFAGGSNS